MRLLAKVYHPDVDVENSEIIHRDSTRSIVLNGENILLLYTARYEDYSLPGGGLDENEDRVEGMQRELSEETGARNIRNIKDFGLYEEFRPWYKDNSKVVHMFSYCYTCIVDEKLGQTRYEEYERKNGMKPVWINIHEAISHNEHILRHSEKKGLSIEREIFLLKAIVKDLLSK